MTKLPKSCTHPFFGFIGVVLFTFTVILLRKYPGLDIVQTALILYGAYVIPVIILENFYFKNFAKPTTGLNFSLGHRTPNTVRVMIKLTGMAGTLGSVALFYWVLPEYHGSFYFEYWNFLKTIAPYFLALVIPYFMMIDRYMETPEDGYYHAGLFFLTDWKKVNWLILRQHFLGWLVKSFFLALMYTYFKNNIIDFKKVNFSDVFSDFKHFFDFTYFYLFMIDVVIASAGYLLTFRILDSHIRSTEPTGAGWLAALICYQPFWSVFSDCYIKYSATSPGWGPWLSGTPQYVIWGCLILACICLYVYASIMFGVRFSNLTHRGIITNGPYGWMKHPAYFGKNLSYWLVSVPWISKMGAPGAVRACGMLALLNLVYYWRARTEERHLSRDPVYVEYALAMNEKSIFAPLGRVFPALKYKPPAPTQPITQKKLG